MYNNDIIFLLSIDEYKKYRKNIPECDSKWWLRSPGKDDVHAAFVRADGSVEKEGNVVCDSFIAVRPALCLPKSGLEIGARTKYFGREWQVIAEDLAIAVEPLTFFPFQNTTNGKVQNDYEESDVRQLLRCWLMYQHRSVLPYIGVR